MAGEKEARYGPLLSAADYDAGIARVHDLALAEMGPSPSADEFDRRVRALELDLAIDRRIGVGFPRERREDLLQVRERIEQERKQLSLRLLQREISRTQYAEGMQSIVESMVAALSDSLTPEEVKRFLGVSDLAAAALPLDPDRINPGVGER